MGAGNSLSSKDLIDNEYLKKLCGPDYISHNDPFWNQLLSFNFSVPKTIQENVLFEENIFSFCKNFVINNSRSSNFHSLIRVFLIRSTELLASAQCKDDMFAWQCNNALFVIRVVLKYLVDNLNEENAFGQFQNHHQSSQINNFTNGNHGKIVEEFYQCLFNIIINIPIVDVTLKTHLECVSILIISLSIQIYHPSPQLQSLFYHVIMHPSCSNQSTKLIQKLLENFILYSSLSPSSSSSHSRIYGLTSSLASGIWSVVTLGLTSSGSTTNENLQLKKILSNHSLLLFLVLTNHFYSNEKYHNPYSQAFQSMIDLNSDINTISPTSSSTSSLEKLKINFSALYSSLVITIETPASTLLLYMLLNRCSFFKSYLLSRTDLELLLLPLLKILYKPASNKQSNPAEPQTHTHNNTQHTYICLIIILILTEDNHFSHSIHDIQLKEVEWLEEKQQLKHLSVGSLLALVLLRNIQINMTKMRDQYVHSNCLGALGNMSSHVNNLHYYVAHNLTSLFSLLVKKHRKLIEKINMTKNQNPPTDNLQDDVARLNIYSDMDQEISVLEEVIRMFIEILNSCLSNSLVSNPNLIYSLLYHKDLFIQLNSFPQFQDVSFNLEMILNYFSVWIEKEKKILSISETQNLIKQSALLFKKDRLKKFPELKFRYIEEEKPEDFFIPYTWSVVALGNQNLFLSLSKVRLFTVN